MKLTYLPAKWGRAVCPAAMLSLCLLLAGAPARADVCSVLTGNVVSNCGFESGSFSGWTLSGNLQGGSPPNNFYGVDNTNPNSGLYEAYFGVQGGGGSAIGNLGPFLALTQTLNLSPAQSYQLSFALNQNAPTVAPGYTNHFDVLFGGVPVFSETNAPNSGGYQTLDFRVSTSASPALAGSTLLQFDFQNDSDFYFLDDVVVKAVTPVPEPSYGLLLLPASIIWLWRTRRAVAAPAR